jgi:hypothetical protein
MAKDDIVRQLQKELAAKDEELSTLKREHEKLKFANGVLKKRLEENEPVEHDQRSFKG